MLVWVRFLHMTFFMAMDSYTNAQMGKRLKSPVTGLDRLMQWLFDHCTQIQTGYKCIIDYGKLTVSSEKTLNCFPSEFFSGDVKKSFQFCDPFLHFSVIILQFFKIYGFQRRILNPNNVNTGLHCTYKTHITLTNQIMPTKNKWTLYSQLK